MYVSVERSHWVSFASVCTPQHNYRVHRVAVHSSTLISFFMYDHPILISADYRIRRCISHTPWPIFNPRCLHTARRVAVRKGMELEDLVESPLINQRMCRLIGTSSFENCPEGGCDPPSYTDGSLSQPIIHTEGLLSLRPSPSSDAHPTLSLAGFKQTTE